MYFQESHNLSEALVLAEGVLIPNLLRNVEELHNEARILGDVDTKQGYFSILTSKFKTEIESLIRLEQQILFPLVKKIVNHEDSDFKCIQSFAVLRSYHQRTNHLLQELRESCNNLVIDMHWSDLKRKSCLNLYEMEQAYLKFVNFMEGTFFLLLTPFCTQQN